MKGKKMAGKTHYDSEPRIVIEQELKEILQNFPVRDILYDMFKALGDDKAAQPPQVLTRFPDETGDFITYLGVLAQHKVFGAKLSPYIVADGKTVVSAWTILMSMTTGKPLLWCDAGPLTIERTAGTTALAVDLLASPDADCLTIVGAGPIAIAHLRHVISLRNWRKISVFSRGAGADLEKRKRMTFINDRVSFAESAELAMKDADVILLCTSSGTPVISLDTLKHTALVTSISTNAPQAHEIAPEDLGSLAVYCDHKCTTPYTAGEMVLATERHGWSASEIIGDLPDLILNRCEKTYTSKPKFFRSVGLGLEDIAMAHAVWRKLHSP